MGGPEGLAYVATVSFLASRLVPSAGFMVALAGGVAVARAGALYGLRRGYGASLAAMLESVAIMGPARVGVPLTQALSAPLLGVMEHRGRPAWAQIAVAAVVRLTHQAITAAFFVFVIAGGLDAYGRGYDALVGWLPLLPDGETGAIAVLVGGLLAWTAVGSTIQVHVYRRGLRAWPADAGAERRAVSPPAPRPTTMRFDPRLVVLAGAIALAALLASTEWPLLAGVAAWLVLATLVARPERDVAPAGLLFAGILGLSALTFGLAGGEGADLALRRASRAALLVLVATWVRGAAGAEGLREVARRALARGRRIPSIPEAAATLDRLGSDRLLTRASRSLVAAMSQSERRPVALLDAALGWVASESGRYRAVATDPGSARTLRVRAGDWGLAAAALAAAAPLLA